MEVIEGFEGPTEWEPILTSALAAEQLKRVDDPHRGAAAIMFSFGRENIRGIRGFYYQTTEGPLPVIVSSALAETTGIGRGDFVRALIAERGVTVVVRGVADYFPTMSRRDGRFIVADLDALLSRVNILGGLTAPLRPNEMFLAENPSSPEPVRDSIAIVRAAAGRPEAQGHGAGRAPARPAVVRRLERHGRASLRSPFCQRRSGT